MSVYQVHSNQSRANLHSKKMFSAAKLLDHIPVDSSLELKKLEKILKLTKKSDKDKLLIAIDALSKLQILHKSQNEHISKLGIENFIKARIRCSTKGYCFATRDDASEDIYIRDQYLNNAWHGDNVLVKITKEGARRKR